MPEWVDLVSVPLLADIWSFCLVLVAVAGAVVPLAADAGSPAVAAVGLLPAVDAGSPAVAVVDFLPAVGFGFLEKFFALFPGVAYLWVT